MTAIPPDAPEGQGMSDWNPDRKPMPSEPVWHLHVATRCSCRDGLSLDENWSPEYVGDERADPPWPGEGWLVCGICEGDGWYWRRQEVPPEVSAAITQAVGS